MKFNPKEVKQIKEIVDFLNNEFPPENLGNKFFAHHPRGTDGNLDIWCIYINDGMLYLPSSAGREELDFCLLAIRTKYKNLRFFMAFQYHITKELFKGKKNGGITVS